MYKTILVHVDSTAASAQRVELAARLAIANDAHLVGTALTDMSAFMFPVSAMGAGVSPIVFPIDDLRGNAERALDVFESRAHALGVGSVERRHLDDEVGVGLCLQARYADLVVISRAAAPETHAPAMPSPASYVVLNCARPVLVLPESVGSGAIGTCVTVAWNGSPQAVRAIASAIPMLRRAERVHLLVLLEHGDPGWHGEQPGGTMAAYLARHGVTVELDARRGEDDNGQALLSWAEKKGSDLIVMGAFGHSRLREFVLGGVTRTVLRSSPIALWMAH